MTTQVDDAAIQEAHAGRVVEAGDLHALAAAVERGDETDPLKIADTLAALGASPEDLAEARERYRARAGLRDVYDQLDARREAERDARQKLRDAEERFAEISRRELEKQQGKIRELRRTLDQAATAAKESEDAGRALKDGSLPELRQRRWDLGQEKLAKSQRVRDLESAASRAGHDVAALEKRLADRAQAAELRDDLQRDLSSARSYLAKLKEQLAQARGELQGAIETQQAATAQMWEP